MRPGQIVKSKAGRDKGQFLVVVEILCDRTKVADGRKRKLASPKLKNPMHLEPTNAAVELDGLTDRQLRKELSVYREKSQEGGS